MDGNDTVDEFLLTNDWHGRDDSLHMGRSPRSELQNPNLALPCK